MQIGCNVDFMTTPLRKVLRINAVVSGSSGAVCAALGTQLARVLDVPSLAVRLTGVGLIGFAVFVGVSSRSRPSTLVRQARVIGFADATWVVGTVAALATGVFSASGATLVSAVGAVVAAFAWFELSGVARLTATGVSASAFGEAAQ